MNCCYARYARCAAIMNCCYARFTAKICRPLYCSARGISSDMLLAALRGKQGSWVPARGPVSFFKVQPWKLTVVRNARPNPMQICVDVYACGFTAGQNTWKSGLGHRASGPLGLRAVVGHGPQASGRWAFGPSGRWTVAGLGRRAVGRGPSGPRACF